MLALVHVAPPALVPEPLQRAPGGLLQRLTDGGDARIALQADGCNRYGCTPRPDTTLLAFGSSTASSISQPAFDAAARLHAQLLADPSSLPTALQRLRHELLASAGAPSGTELVWAASGTDLHLIATQLAAGDGCAGLQAVMAAAAETGSGVPAAMAARHFGGLTCQGREVAPDAPLATAALPPPVGVALRESDGTARSAAAIDADFTAAAETVLASGRRCLLVLTDVSKTGLLAPSAACARRLQLRFGGRLKVLVDACQFRLAPASVAAYLAQDFMVAVTGSKFVTGPAFCGALLLPAGFSRAARRQPLGVLAPYSSRSDWPADWAAAAALDTRPNIGLLLRWQAALTELRRFRAVPDADIATFLRRWGAAVAARLAADPCFEALPVPALARGGPGDANAWDRLQTVFPLLVMQQRADGRRVPLPADATARLWRRLQQGSGAGRVQFGQPVACGSRDGQPLGALRLCSSARWVATHAGNAALTDTAITLAMQALDRLAAQARHG